MYQSHQQIVKYGSIYLFPLQYKSTLQVLLYHRNSNLSFIRKTFFFLFSSYYLRNLESYFLVIKGNYNMVKTNAETCKPYQMENREVL